MNASLRSYRRVLLATAASFAALAGGMLLPAEASAQPAGPAGTPDAVTITASFAQNPVNAGSTDKLSGVASYISGDSPQPLASTVLAITTAGYGISGTVTTAADGSFSYVTPAIGTAEASVNFTVSSSATPDLKAGKVTVTLHVNQTAVIHSFRGTLSPDRVLRFYACGGIEAPPADGLLDGPLDYQYSRAAHGPWKTLGAGKTVADGHCFAAENGGTYPGKFKAPLASGYYRAYAPAVPGQMSAVSQVIHLSRYPAKVSGWTVSRRSVSRDGRVTVSGRLLEHKGKWLPDKRAKITIEYRYDGNTHKLRQELTTNSAGRFSGTFRVPRSAAWLAVYNGGSKDFATASTVIRITVR